MTVDDRSDEEKFSSCSHRGHLPEYPQRSRTAVVAWRCYCNEAWYAAHSDGMPGPRLLSATTPTPTDSKCPEAHLVEHKPADCFYCVSVERDKFRKESDQLRSKLKRMNDVLARIAYDFELAYKELEDFR